MLKTIITSEKLEKYVLLLLLAVSVIALIAAPLNNKIFLIKNVPEWIIILSAIVAILIIISLSGKQAEISSEMDNGPGMIIGPMIAGGGIGGLLSISMYFIYQLIQLI